MPKKEIQPRSSRIHLLHCETRVPLSWGVPPFRKRHEARCMK
jgi:hypothetical protein